MINRRILLAALTAIGLACVTASAALAQTYPTRPIKIIVPFLAGGTVDIVARQIGQQLSALLGQHTGRAALCDRPEGDRNVRTRRLRCCSARGHDDQSHPVQEH